LKWNVAPKKIDREREKKGLGGLNGVGETLARESTKTFSESVQKRDEGVAFQKADRADKEESSRLKSSKIWEKELKNPDNQVAICEEEKLRKKEMKAKNVFLQRNHEKRGRGNGLVVEDRSCRLGVHVRGDAGVWGSGIWGRHERKPGQGFFSTDENEGALYERDMGEEGLQLKKKRGGNVRGPRLPKRKSRKAFDAAENAKE